MAELLFLPAGQHFAEFPPILVSVLPSVPPWAEIYHVRLTQSTLTQAWYEETQCPVDLAKIIEAKLGPQAIDFERETLLVLTWADHTRSEFHFLMGASRKWAQESAS